VNERRHTNEINRNMTNNYESNNIVCLLSDDENDIDSNIGKNKDNSNNVTNKG